MDSATISCMYYINFPWGWQSHCCWTWKWLKKTEWLFHKNWAQNIWNSTIFAWNKYVINLWRKTSEKRTGGQTEKEKKSKFEGRERKLGVGRRDWKRERQCWVKRSMWDYKTKLDLTWPISDCSFLCTQTCKWRIMSPCFSKMTLAITSTNTFCSAQCTNCIWVEFSYTIMNTFKCCVFYNLHSAYYLLENKISSIYVTYIF